MQRSSLPGSMRSVSKTFSCVAIMFATLGLAACGGGGGSDNPSPPANPPPPAPPPPSAPANTAPVVDAGADQTIKLPANAVDVSGTATDAPGSTLAYSWAAAPAAGVTFANATAAATNVTFTDAGTYTLTLSVSDGTATGTDSVVVTVSAADPAPPPPPPPPPAAVVWPGTDSETDPNHGWTAAAPADVGMDSARLIEAETYAAGGSGLIARGGKLVHKWGDIDTRFDIKSATKSMGSIALGLALDGPVPKIALSDTAQSRYAGFGTTSGGDATWLSQITIQQLATHTAGFEKDRRATVPLINAPGTKWLYSDGGLNWLADTLTNVFQQDLSALLNTRVWTPLEITTDDLQWRAVPSGEARPAIGTLTPREFASGIIANPNAMARVGLLFLRKGVWKDSRILSESFVQQVSTPLPATASAELIDPVGFPSANKGYGLMWWTNAERQLPDVPADAYWAWGLGDSLIVVIPSLDLVISRVGAPLTNRPVWNGNYEVLRPFLTPIVQSIATP
jgi:CubicO group peptidase (beta-lactamase class C family)